MVVALGGGWLAVHVTGSLTGLFTGLGIALPAYSLVVAAAVANGVWFAHVQRTRRSPGPPVFAPASSR